MKKFIPFSLVFAMLALINVSGLLAQGSAQCKGCTHATPAVFTSNKNAVTIYGAPDGKGKPVEYQIFSQSKLDNSWKLETSGVMDRPGSQETFKYARPAQLMVLVYCDTPFGNMVSFSNVKFAAPPSNN